MISLGGLVVGGCPPPSGLEPVQQTADMQGRRHTEIHPPCTLYTKQPNALLPPMRPPNAADAAFMTDSLPSGVATSAVIPSTLQPLALQSDRRLSRASALRAHVKTLQQHWLPRVCASQPTMDDRSQPSTGTSRLACIFHMHILPGSQDCEFLYHGPADPEGAPGYQAGFAV